MSPGQLRRAVQVLRAGGLIAYPTEAVYGLGCDPLDAETVIRLLTLKGRPVEKGLILIAADVSQLRPYIETLDPQAMAQVWASWPGPTTWLMPARSEVPVWLTGAHRTIAVRVTAHPLAATLCEHFGDALVSTSANRSDNPPARTALAVRKHFGRAIDHIVHGRVGGARRPSEIRNAVTGAVIRAG